MTQAEATAIVGTLIVLALVGMGLLTIGLVFKQTWATIAAGLAWLGFSFLGFLSRSSWDMAPLFIWFGIGVGLVSMLSAIGVYRSNRPEPPDAMPPDEEYEEELNEIRRQRMERRRKRWEEL